MNHMFPEMQACIEACQQCRMTCMAHLQNDCLSPDDSHAVPDHVRVMRNCVLMCQTSAYFMLRMSPRYTDVCRECAEVCYQCAASCLSLAGLEACVETCRDCAQKCREIALQRREFIASESAMH